MTAPRRWALVALVAAGVPVDELTPERRTLEQIVLEATRAEADVTGVRTVDDEADPQPTGGAR